MNTQEFTRSVYQAIMDPNKSIVAVGEAALVAYDELNQSFNPTSLPDTMASRIVIQHFDDIKDAREHIRDAKPKLYTHQIRDIHHYLGGVLVKSALLTS